MKYAKNTKKKILLHVPQTGMTIPATLICGRETGKTITVSAGVHSREYIGIELLGEIRNIFSEPLCRIHAETDGVVLYQTASLGIEAGAPMIAYGELEKEV